MLSIDDLHKEDLLKLYKIQSEYDKIVNHCYEDILYTHRNVRKNKMFFSVPYEIFDKPDYNFIDCIAYVIKEVRAGGFYVRFIKPNWLYISWNNPSKANNHRDNLRLLAEEDQLTQRTLETLMPKKIKLLEYHKGKKVVYKK